MDSKIKVKYPIGIRWKISEEDLQELRSSTDEYLESDSFIIPETDIEYYISIFPNGNDEERRGETWTFLNLEFENEEKKQIEAQFTISIETTNFVDETEHVYKKSEGSGFSICTVDELFDPEKKFIVDGDMLIKIEGFLIIEKDALDNSCEIDISKNELCMILWNQQNKDFAIVADGKEIHAHKCVLSGRSPVFEAMFKHQEAQEGKVIIPDFSFNVVEAAIKFCYDSRLVGDVSFDDQMSLLQFFDKYDMDSLKKRLQKHLITKMDETNVCLLANCSLISNAPKLRLKCSVFVVFQNFL